jgi:rSAM-partnered protein
MAEHERTPDADHPRSATEREWEVFAREDGTLRHVGSVTAPAADVAHEEATTLFGWASEAVWLCPADEVHRYSTGETP